MLADRASGQDERFVLTSAGARLMMEPCAGWTKSFNPRANQLSHQTASEENPRSKTFTDSLPLRS